MIPHQPRVTVDEIANLFGVEPEFLRDDPARQEYRDVQFIEQMLAEMLRIKPKTTP